MALLLVIVLGSPNEAPESSSPLSSKRCFEGVPGARSCKFGVVSNRQRRSSRIQIIVIELRQSE